ncbi:MAG TPA: right-handed parallel beta-helix repeat-containing protein [Phycisphaerae bacterium]|nr:right-handed parallel beta-helix repeat-containing protein [Phycisphaerae bacterium]HSA30128.1 right-handed parallel beta-helix repeat-containing protein [Phycisphaerae bacterium]
MDASAVLDGFTVTGGNADGGFDPADKGSGMYSQSGHPTIRNCVFTGNGNDAQGGGGGIFASSSHPTIRDCVFRNNRTNGHGAGICNDNDSHPLVVNCLFEGNLGPAGGGMANSNGSAPRLINCRFLGNSAKWATGGGGGLFNVSGAHPTLVNCVFVGNAVSYWGGAIYNDWWDGANQCTLINCTVAGNYSAISGLSSTNGGGLTGGTFRLTNCVLWGNHNCRNAVPFCVSDQSEDRQVLGSVVEVNHSCVQGWTGSLGGVGNTGADPLFVRPPDIGPDGIPATADDDYGDLRLQAGSPAADAGDNYVDINPDTPGNQPLLGVDLDAHLRRHDDPDAADTGNGAAPIVDMGAYERGSASIPPTLYVRRGASGSNTGTIWADAFTELRVALDTAWAAGPTVTEIWVAASTYAPSDPAGDRTASFNLPNGVQVYGGFTGTETSLDQRNPDPRTNLTILSGDLSGDDVGGFGDMSRAENSYHVATIAAGGPGTVLDGFTITGGYADGAGLDTQGAGLLLLGGRPLLGNLLVVDNSASVAGGGIYSHFSHPTIGDLALDLNASPAGGGGVMLKNWNHVEGTFALNGADPAEPTVLDVRSCQFEGAGWLDLSAAGKLYVSQAPFYEPARFRANLRGTGSLEIAPGQHLILEGAACVDLRIPGTGTPCVDPGGTPGGTILIDGTLLARQESQIRNANITVRQADIQGGSQIQYNDVFLIDAINSGGQLFVEGNATVANNLITSIGDRYLDLDPDPNAPEHPNIDQNTFRVVIETDPALAQGTLLELRSRDDDCGTAANPDCLSGAHPTSLGERFAGEPAQNWVLDTLEIKPGAKLNLTNRPGFEFHEGLAHPEAVYVRHLILHENAVLNTALQTLYYESLTDESGNPLHPAALPGGRRIVDEPLLGFSLGIIAMNDQTASLFNEFDIRVHRRMRDPLDLQPNPPAPALEGSIQLLPNARNPATQDGVMEMRTRAADRAPARSVAAKGAFARAGEEDIVVTFEYLFHATGPGTVLEVYLSDSPRVSERIFKVAELTPPPADLSGGTASSQYGLFVGRFPRVAPQYTLNFTRGTYVELELRGDDSIVWIDNFDPQVWCHQVCANFDQRPGADEMDYLVLLAETGRSVPVGRWCLDLNEDGYVNLGDIQVWEVAYNSRYRCPTWITGACYLPDGRCVIDTELGCSQAGGVYAGNRTGCGQDSRRSSGQGELATGQGSGTSSGTGMGKLRILGKPGSNDDQSDHLYDVAETGLATARSPAPCPEPGSEDCQRGGARLVQDPAGRVYLVHSVYGMLTADTGQILVSPGRKAFQGDIVQVGLDEDGSGLPLSDVAFDPNPPAQGGNGIPESVYVVPLVVTPAGSNHPYTAAARLRLLGNGDFEVATVFGLDPLDPSVQARPENGCLNCRPLVTGGSCRPSCDFSGMREIEVDASGNVFVASATQYNDNDWILVFDESLDSPGHEKARFLLSSLFAEGGPVPPPEGPATLLVSRSSDETLRDHLYLTASVGRSGGLSTRVYRFAIDSGGLGLAFAGAVEIENPPPDICGPDGPLTCDGYVSSITSMLEAPDGRLFTVGWTAPEFSDDAPLPVDRVFTTPTVAAVPPSTAWSAFGPVSRIEAAKIAADDLALPVSAVLLSNAPADFDVDGDVDQDDFGHLQSCATGPEVPQEEETCRDADLDHDGDADQSDFGVFQRCYRGAGKPPDPNCEK